MIDFDGLDQDPNLPSSKSEGIRKNAHIVNGGESMFTCPDCNGSGRFISYAGRYVGPCFKCKGNGSINQGQVSATKGVATRKANHAAFIEEHAGLISALREISSWHTFANSLLQQLDDGRRLTENQIAAAQRSLIKVAERNKERHQQNIAKLETKSGDVNISAITALFATATDNDIKRPVFRADGVEISKAPMHGRNAGALYVKSEDDVYLGKIVEGKFIAAGGAQQDTLAHLKAIAADPTAAAIKYARRTSKCSCCGRVLVDPISIRAGIGPICAENWGLDYRRELARDELKVEKENEAR